MVYGQPFQKFQLFQVIFQFYFALYNWDILLKDEFSQIHERSVFPSIPIYLDWLNDVRCLCGNNIHCRASKMRSFEVIASSEHVCRLIAIVKKMKDASVHA